MQGSAFDDLRSSLDDRRERGCRAASFGPGALSGTVAGNKRVRNGTDREKLCQPRGELHRRLGQQNCGSARLDILRQPAAHQCGGEDGKTSIIEPDHSADRHRSDCGRSRIHASHKLSSLRPR